MWKSVQCHSVLDIWWCHLGYLETVMDIFQHFCPHVCRFVHKHWNKTNFWIEAVTTFPRVLGGGVPCARCGEWSEDCPGPGGLHQQEGGQTDRDDCGVRGHALRGTAPDREKAEGDWWVPQGTVVVGGGFPRTAYYFIFSVLSAWYDRVAF